MKKFVLLVLLSTFAIVLAQFVSDQYQLIKIDTTIKILDSMMVTEKPKNLFKAWHYLFKPAYSLSSEIAIAKYNAFKTNLMFIKETNAKQLSYTLGLNQFSDLTNEEYRKLLTKKLFTIDEYKQMDSLEKEIAKTVESSNIRKTLLNQYDDQNENDESTRRNLQSTLKNVNHTPFLRPIRNQGSCGSCWAFSAVATIEGNYNKANPNAQLIDNLSIQQLVDCDYSNGGCNGGSGFDAFKYIDLNGLSYDASYPYKEVKNTCNIKIIKSPVKSKSIKFCSNYWATKQCTRQIINNLLVAGPLSVGIDAGTRDFQSYRSGVFTAPCTNDNHAVVLVGFVMETSAVKGYLLVRNSWGLSWGEKGYIKVGLNTMNNNSCFVENEGILPIIVK